MLSSRLVLVLDDLLWVLTDSQLKAALHFVDSLSDLIRASTEQNQKTKARKKLETMPDYQSQIIQQSTGGGGTGMGGGGGGAGTTATESAAQRYFNVFDVRETSYHFFSKRIDLHLCDDDGGEGYKILDGLFGGFVVKLTKSRIIQAVDRVIQS